jgi:hypothetical protein
MVRINTSTANGDVGALKGFGPLDIPRLNPIRQARRSFRQEPNAPSGGQVSDLDIGSFLSRRPLNPEHQALLRLIATCRNRRIAARVQ